MKDERTENQTHLLANLDSTATPSPNQSSSPKCDEEILDESLPTKESMMFALFITWIFPVFILAIFSRKLTDTSVPIIAIDRASSSIHRESHSVISSTMTSKSLHQSLPQIHQKPTPNVLHDNSNSFPSWAPVSYRKIVVLIRKRRRHIEGYSDVINSPPKVEFNSKRNANTTGSESIPENRRGISSDPVRANAIKVITDLKDNYHKNPNDIFRALALADSMRFYDMKYHEGGTFEVESIQLFQKIVMMAEDLRKAAISRDEATNYGIENINEEIFVDYKEKSIDGLLCAIYASQGKVYFMANMFEKAVESYTSCIRISPYYLDAVNSRGSASLVLGNYRDSGRDFLQVVKEDKRRLFIDAFNGIARVLEASENSVPGGWQDIVDVAESLITVFEEKISNQPQARNVASSALNRLHHFMFTYHDIKTKNHETAFKHLTESYKHKMSSLPAWKEGSELFKIQQTKRIFTTGFWPPNIGSSTRVPIFIIGFVRSGSTLLERILDSHPNIVGTGENSVFNGRLDDIRNQIVHASVSGQENAISDLTRRLAEEVVDEMRRRWQIIDQNTGKASNETEKEPRRFVDKMLTNYYNVGFIHMLYPNSLILHVVREPMDTLFSAYKHEFPAGTLDYTSDFKSLSELYAAYRDIMNHWDLHLPGRVTHILYEDMVTDTERIAKAVIEATGLQWDDNVLAFHKKKQAVNTLSSTQVRKGIYTSGLNSWKLYQRELLPLVGLIGDLIAYNVSTSLPKYSPSLSKDSATCIA